MNDRMLHWTQDYCYKCGDNIVWFGGLCDDCREKKMKQVECPECGSIHVAVSHIPLCGSPSEKVMVFWAVCNEMECRQQFHVLYDLVPSKTTKLEKERWLKI